MSRQMFGADDLPLGPSWGQVLFVDETDAPIRLYKKRGKNGYAVQYGKQIDYELLYANAAKKLGECILHSLCCQGKLEDE